MIWDTVYNLRGSMDLLKAFYSVASGLPFCYKAPLTSNIWGDFTGSTALYSSCITDGGHGAQVKGRVGVWEVYCACEFWNGIM